MNAGLRRLILSALLTTACGAHAAQLPDWAEEVRLAAKGLKTTSQAIVLLDEWSLDLTQMGRRMERRWVVSVLGNEGSTAAMLMIHDSTLERVASLRAWSRDPRGRVTRYDMADGTLLGLVERTTFDDDQLLILRAGRAPAGTTFAVSYQVESNPDMPQHLFPVRSALPVRLFRLTATAAEGVEARIAVSGAANPGPDRLVGRGVWEFRDLPELVVSDDPLAHRPPNILLAVNYALGGEHPMASWPGVVGWALGLNRRASEKAERYAALDRQVRAAADPIAMARTESRAIRYFSMARGWAGWVPRAPEVTLARRFGDCKDKALLMTELLEGAGLHAVPVLIASPADSAIDPALPSPFVFNHAIAGVLWEGRPVTSDMVVVDSPGLGKLRLFDATLPPSTPHDLPYQLDGAIGLALDPATTGVLRVPERDASGNRFFNRCHWRWSDRESATLDCTLEASGINRAALEPTATDRSPEETSRRFLIAWLGAACPGFTALAVDPVRRDPSGAWSLPYRYSCPDTISRFGTTSLLRPPSFASLDYFPLPGLRRASTVYQPFLRSIVDELRIAEADRFGSLPAPMAVKNSIGSVSATARREADELVLTRAVSADHRSIEVEDADAVRELRAALRSVASWPLPVDAR